MAVTSEQVKRLFGDLEPKRVVDIIDTGASMTEMEEAAAYLALETDVMGDLEKPLTGRARQVYDIVREGEEAWEEDR